MTKAITMSIFLLTLLIGWSASAGTPQEWGKWKEGELLLENHSFEEDLAAWGLEDGACCGRGGLYTMEIDKKNPQHGKQSLKVIGHKATGTAWHAKVRQKDASMKSGETYTVIFWARAEKPREVQPQHPDATRSVDLLPRRCYQSIREGMGGSTILPSMRLTMLKETCGSDYQSPNPMSISGSITSDTLKVSRKTISIAIHPSLLTPERNWRHSGAKLNRNGSKNVRLVL